MLCTCRERIGYEDLKNIYVSGLDHRIIRALDKFDEKQDVPKTDKEYLNALKNLRWGNSNTKKLLKKLNYFKSLIGQERFRLTYQVGIQRAEDKFILFTAGCSAVNEGKDKINENDIIKAYKTYFKLMKTDITKYKVETEIDVNNPNNGYLICKKCERYYKLQYGESPGDFSDECECGGELMFIENLDDF